MAKNRIAPEFGTDDALARAYQAAGKLKRKHTAVYWAVIAHTMVLREIRDELRAAREVPGSSVTLPGDAPPRERARVSVTEP